MTELSTEDIKVLHDKMKRADCIERYISFPEVIRAVFFACCIRTGLPQKEGFIELYRTDTFGKIFSFTKKGKLFFLLPEYLEVDRRL